jgi:hypothetical protein
LFISPRSPTMRRRAMVAPRSAALMALMIMAASIRMGVAQGMS